MVLLKNGHFSNFFILGIIGQQNVFYDIQERNNTFLSYKNKKFKKSKKWHFSKGVNQWFWSKNGHFSNFLFLGNIGQEKVFYHILELNSAFLGYKNKKSKKNKNWHFSSLSSKSRKTDIFLKGLTHGFDSKMAIFQTFFFRQYRPGKCLLRYSRTKKRLSRL